MSLISYSHCGESYMYKDSHELHVYCGKFILYASIVHTVTDIFRYALQGNLNLMIDHKTGVTGIIIVLATLLICLPMMYRRKKTPYELRKYVHHLFIVFLIGLLLHIPKNSGGWAFVVAVVLLVWFGVDWLYVYFFMTERIKSSRFYVLPTGVQLTMAVSERFQQWGSGGYCYVCFPWVDKNQWHAFSLFENPKKPEERQIFIQALGDWSKQVHASLGRDTTRAVFVQGPFASPYGSAVNFDNSIIVAGGIGITPALSVIRELKATRRCNLIWATRDRHMLEFFLKNAQFDDNGWNLIFYTGKEPLLGIDEVVVTNHGSIVYVIRERPNLHTVLPNIVHGIESGTCTPEMLVPDNKAVALELLHMKLTSLTDESSSMPDAEIISKLEAYSEELGYYFSDLVSRLPGVDVAGDGSMDHRAIIDALLSFLDEGKGTSGRPGVDGGTRRSVFYCKQGTGTFRNYGDQIATCSWDTLCGAIAKSNRNRDVEAGLLDHQKVYKPWKANEAAMDYVASLPDCARTTWGVFYCGGKTPLLHALTEAAETANIEMHSESFAW